MLEKELASPATFKIVCFHEPIYCSGGHSPRKDVRAVWESLFIKYGVNVVFQSRNHYYQRSNPINGIIYVISGGGGAPLYNPGYASFVNKSRKAYHYCVLDVNLSRKEMVFYAKDTDGNVFDSVVFHGSSLKVRISKPDNGLYIFNRKIAGMSSPVIIGKIDVVANVTGDASAIEFYVDGVSKYNDTAQPYTWTWDEFAIGKHEIMVRAYGNDNTASDEMSVFIFNL